MNTEVRSRTIGLGYCPYHITELVASIDWMEQFGRIPDWEQSDGSTGVSSVRYCLLIMYGEQYEYTICVMCYVLCVAAVIHLQI